jgi:hypothetical protein
MSDYFDILEDMSEGLAGQGINVKIREAALAQTNIENGVFVTLGSAQDTCTLPDAAGEVTESGLGISELDNYKPAGSSAAYDSGEMVRIVRRGLVWCPVEDSSTAGQHPFVRITAKATPLANEALGRFRSDADGADSGVATEQTECLFRTTQATAGGLALVEINLP